MFGTLHRTWLETQNSVDIYYSTTHHHRVCETIQCRQRRVVDLDFIEADEEMRGMTVVRLCQSNL